MRAHRDETSRVIRRNSQKTAISLQSSSKLVHRSRAGEDETCLFVYRIPPTLSQDVASAALGYFFLCYSHDQDTEATCSFFDLLPAMFAKSRVSSPLYKATTAFAIQVASLQGVYNDNTTMAHEMYSESVSSTSDALLSPMDSKSDELLLTTLVLEAYETVFRIFRSSQQPSHPPIHMLGSIALLKHRGVVNYRDHLSWRLVIATRTRLLRYAWQATDKITNIEVLREIWQGGEGDIPTGPAVDTDTLALELAWLKSALYNVPAIEQSPNGTRRGAPAAVPSDFSTVGGVISCAIRLASECSRWYASLPLSWQPVSIAAGQVASSIQASSVYTYRSPVTYHNISIANSYNRHRITELGALSLILKGLMVRSAAKGQRHEQLPSGLRSRVQSLVDDVCASLAFMTGDVNADAVHEVETLLPHACSASLMEENQRNVPAKEVRHARQVVSSGLFMAYGTLTAVLEILGDQTSSMDTAPMIREGQREWMKEQVARLKKILILNKSDAMQ